MQTEEGGCLVGVLRWSDICPAFFGSLGETVHFLIVSGGWDDAQLENAAAWRLCADFVASGGSIVAQVGPSKLPMSVVHQQAKAFLPFALVVDDPKEDVERMEAAIPQIFDVISLGLGGQLIADSLHKAQRRATSVAVFCSHHFETASLVAAAVTAHFDNNLTGDLRMVAGAATAGLVLQQGVLCCSSSGKWRLAYETTGGWVRAGYALARCFRDGSVAFETSLYSSAKLSQAVVLGCLFQSVINPRRYVMADVTINWSKASVSGFHNKIRISGIEASRGCWQRVTATKRSGFVSTAVFLLFGGSETKAIAIGRSVLGNCNADLAERGFAPVLEYTMEIIGGALRLAFAHKERDALESCLKRHCETAARTTVPGLVVVSCVDAAPRLKKFPLLVPIQGTDNMVVEDRTALDSFFPSTLQRTEASKLAIAAVPLSNVASVSVGSVGSSVILVVVAETEAIFKILQQELDLERVQAFLHKFGHSHHHGMHHSHMLLAQHGHNDDDDDDERGCRQQHHHQVVVMESLLVMHLVFSNVLQDVSLGSAGYAHLLMSMEVRIPAILLPVQSKL